jgi:hypothetical protein
MHRRRSVRAVLSIAMGAGLAVASNAAAAGDTRESQALETASELQARFEGLALRFVERFEATGSVHFSDQAARLDAMGQELYDRFLAKADRFAAQDAARAAREAAREAAAEARTDNGLRLAKGRNR